MTSKKIKEFDPQRFLSTIDNGRKIVAFPKKQRIFVQGDSSDAVFYLQQGKVKLTVVSKRGKEATIAILNEGDFFGEGCLAGQPLRLASATALTHCSVMEIDKNTMMQVFHRVFLAHNLRDRQADQCSLYGCTSELPPVMSTSEFGPLFPQRLETLRRMHWTCHLGAVGAVSKLR